MFFNPCLKYYKKHRTIEFCPFSKYSKLKNSKHHIFCGCLGNALVSIEYKNIHHSCSESVILDRGEIYSYKVSFDISTIQQCTIWQCLIYLWLRLSIFFTKQLPSPTMCIFSYLSSRFFIINIWGGGFV